MSIRCATCGRLLLGQRADHEDLCALDVAMRSGASLWRQPIPEGSGLDPLFDAVSARADTLETFAVSDLTNAELSVFWTDDEIAA